MKKAKIAVIGCGTISEIYIDNLVNLYQNTEVVAVSDINQERLDVIASRFGITNGFQDYHEMLKIEDIDIVVNLTTPNLHAKITMDALTAGKHVYVEKPIAVKLEDAKKVMECAKRMNKRVACAPETILGMGTQTARKIIQEGKIGYTTGATAFLMYGGSESWHPNPAFLYKEGGGPLFDAGPYYIAALTYLFGAVKAVSAVASVTFPERTITSQPRYGEKIKVEVPTYVSGNLMFENGQTATIIMTFDVANSKHSFDIEVYGSEGTVIIPFPGNFGGDVFMKRTENDEWRKAESDFCYVENSRGLGVADLAASVLNGRDHRLSVEFGYHVLEVMQAFYTSAANGKVCEVNSTFKSIKDMPQTLKVGEIDK